MDYTLVKKNAFEIKAIIRDAIKHKSPLFIP